MHQKLTLAFACACALVVSLGAASTLRAENTPEPTTTTETDAGLPQFEQREIQRQIDRYRHEVWRWQRTRWRTTAGVERRTRPTSVSGSASTASRGPGTTPILRTTEDFRWT